MPKFDIAAACRGSGAVETVARCTQDEQAARDQLAKLWPQFRQSDASRCVHIVTTGGAANYTELLSCLQAAKTEEKPKDPFGPTPTLGKIRQSRCPLHISYTVGLVSKRRLSDENAVLYCRYVCCALSDRSIGPDDQSSDGVGNVPGCEVGEGLLQVL